MKKIAISKSTRQKIYPFALVIVAFIVMQCLTAAGMVGSFLTSQLVPVCVYIVLAISLNLVVGVSGELSLGHAGFMGVGAFSGVTAAVLLENLIPDVLLRMAAAMLAGGMVAALAGVLIGLPVLRLRGDYLAIVTLAFGEILKNLVTNLYVGMDGKGVHITMNSGGIALAEGGKMIINGPMGITGVTRIATFPVGFVLVLITLFVVLNLIDSKEGRAIKAIRDNRIAAESVGINVMAFRMKAFVVSAFLAGMAGALYGMNYSSISASRFGFTTSINILVFVVLGGMGNILGSIISATVLYILPLAMTALEDLRMILYAVVLIVAMLFTWSPAVKNTFQAIGGYIKEWFAKLGKKGAGNHE